MAYESLKQEIRQYIKTNGQNEITGQILQDVLIDMVNQYPSLDGYATQQWVESQGYISEADLTNYATKDWVSQNFLALDGGGYISNDNDYGLDVSENGLRFYYNGSVVASLLVSNTPDGPVLDISSGTTIGGYTIWNSGNLNPSDYMPSSTAVINSVVGDELGHLTLTGPNFSTTVLDFSHQHRWEELIDVPTNLRDLGITEEYLPLSAGSTKPLTGDLYMSIDDDTFIIEHSLNKYKLTANNIWIVAGLDYKFGNLFEIGDNYDNYIRLNSTSIKIGYWDVDDGDIDQVVIQGNSITIDGNAVATQNWVSQQGYITSSALSGYATKDWVGLNFLGLNGGGMITNSNDYGLSVAENGLRFYYNGSVVASLLVSNTPDGPVLDISSGTTIGGYTIWNSGNLNPSNYMLSSTAVINSVVGDELGHLTLTGPNFSATVLDFSHQHRWEELIDVPTNLRDLGITEEYLPLSAGSTKPLTGDLYMSIDDDTFIIEHSLNKYKLTANNIWIVAGLDYKFGNLFEIGDNYDNYIRLNSTSIKIGYWDVDDGDIDQVVIQGNGITIDGNAVATQNWVSQQGYITSSALSGYATQSWVSSNYATQSAVNGLSYINGIALNGDGSLSLTGHSFTTTVLDMTHQHRWEELIDRPLIDMWNDTMVAVNGIVSSGRIGAGVVSTPSYMLEVNGQTMLYYEVGIGTAPSSGISLDIDGTARAGSFVNNSDIRKKDVIEYDIDPGFEMIANAPTIRFTWKDRGLLDSRGECVGSIAQYWQLALPEAVMTDSDGYLSMQYDVIALISAISVAKRVASHEQRIEALERENALLRMDIKALKNEA